MLNNNPKVRKAYVAHALMRPVLLIRQIPACRVLFSAALENILNGHMIATAWQNSFSERYNMIKLLVGIKADKNWKPKAVEVPAVLVTADSVGEFVGMHPEALGK